MILELQFNEKTLARIVTAYLNISGYFLLKFLWIYPSNCVRIGSRLKFDKFPFKPIVSKIIKLRDF